MNPSTAFGRVFADELARCGLREVVISPGSRSTPLAMAFYDLERAGRLRLHVRIDERGASFTALGLAKASRRPVAVVCTSGTAAANFHPAVIEADESGVPLLALTADRPPELRAVGASQTIDQVKMFSGAVRWYAESGVPEKRPGAVGYWRSLACQAWAQALGASGTRPGPVHLNLPFRDPLVPDADDGGAGDGPVHDGPVHDDPDWPESLAGRPGGQPWTRFAPAASAPAPAPLELPWTERGLVVCGDGDYDPAPLLELARRAGWPVLAEPSSGARRGPNAIVGYQYLLAAPGFMAAHRPDVIVSAGRPGLSRPQTALMALARPAPAPSPAPASGPASGAVASSGTAPVPGVVSPPGTVPDPAPDTASPRNTASPWNTASSRNTASSQSQPPGTASGPVPASGLAAAGSASSQGPASAPGPPPPPGTASARPASPPARPASPPAGPVASPVSLASSSVPPAPSSAPPAPSSASSLAGQIRHVVIAEGPGQWADPQRAATDVAASVRLTGAPEDPGLITATSGSRPGDWLRDWLRADKAALRAADAVLEDTVVESTVVESTVGENTRLDTGAESGAGPGPGLTEPLVARELLAMAPAGALIWAGNSMSVRDIDWQLGVRDDLRVLASRGASGIDGTASTAAGAALAHAAAGGGPAFALLGDLAFVHDASGLALGPEEPRPDLCLIVVNNDGGGIFAGMEPAAFPGPFERVFGTPHRASFEHLAAAFGLPYTLVTSPGELVKALDGTGFDSTGLRVVEARTDRAANAELRSRMRAAAIAAITP